MYIYIYPQGHTSVGRVLATEPSGPKKEAHSRLKMYGRISVHVDSTVKKSIPSGEITSFSEETCIDQETQE